MAIKTLSNPTIEVNDNPISIIPNSCSYKIGIGNRNVKSQSAGGNSVEIIITEDAETKYSTMKFKMYNTPGNLQNVKDWSSLDGNTIRISEGEVAQAFSDMVLISEPEVMVGAEGEIELEWAGSPTV